MLFKKNEGPGDRWARAIFGVVVLGLAYSQFSGWVQIIGYIVGAILIFTAITGFCTLYKILGISTAKEEGSGENQQK